MELKFLGRGAAFNVKEGNTSAYFIENDTLFLIDCGETVFSRIMQKNLLEGIKNVYVFITHLHPDHVGSLGTLIFYCTFVLKNPLSIVINSNLPYYNDLISLLTAVGCTENMYHLVKTRELIRKYNAFNSVMYDLTNHCPEIPSCSISFYTSEGAIYYSGDSNDLRDIQSLCVPVLYDKIKAIYVDVTSLDYPENVHLCIHHLAKYTPEYFRAKIYCMHFNNDDCIRLARNYGFNIVEVD